MIHSFHVATEEQELLLHEFALPHHQTEPTERNCYFLAVGFSLQKYVWSDFLYLNVFFIVCRVLTAAACMFLDVHEDRGKLSHWKFVKRLNINMGLNQVTIVWLLLLQAFTLLL